MIVKYTISDLVNVFLLCGMRFALPLKLLNRDVTYYSRLLWPMATARSLFEPGRLRPHPSLRDHGLRFSAGRPTSTASALMIFTGCLENIAGPNHFDAQ